MTSTAPTKGIFRRLPVWLRIVLIGVVFLLLVAIVAPYFLDVDHYRPEIAAAVMKQTRRTVTIGKIRAKFLPSAGFVISDVHLGNPPGFPAGDFLSVETLTGSLAWGPLLHKEIQINSIELDRPKLTLLTDARGRTNYDFSAGGEGAHSAKQGEKAGDSASGSSSFALEGIAKVVLSGAEISMGQVRSRGQIDSTGQISGLNLEMENLLLDATAIKRIVGDANLSGMKLEMGGMSAPIEFTSGHVKLHDGAAEGEFKAQLGKAADVKGTLKIADLLNPVTEFELSTDQLNVTALLAETSVADKKAGGQSPAQTAIAAPENPNHLIAKGKIIAAQIFFKPYTANNGLVEVRVYNDRVEISPAEMQLYGGTLRLTARADRTQYPMRFTASVKVSNFDIGKFVSVDPATKGKITGTADLELHLAGSAGSRMLASLTGTGNFGVHDGTLPGMNLHGALGTIAKLMGGSNASTTPFRVIQGDLGVAQERVGSKQIHMDSTEGIVDLRGSFGFDKTIDYEGQATLAGGGANPIGMVTTILGSVLGQTIKSASIPFAVRGTFSNPKVAAGNGIPGFQSASPNTSQTNQQQKPTLQDTLKDLFKKP